MTNHERLRLRLGEPVPSDGSAEDTLFTDQQIDDLLASYDTDFDAAVAEGWQIKAALLADLVDTAEGTSKRAMSDLHKNALKMVDATGGGSGGSQSRTRIHPLTRM